MFNRLTKSKKQTDLNSYLKDEAERANTVDEKALATYFNLLTKCQLFEEGRRGDIYDQVFDHLSTVTEHYDSLNTKTRNAVDNLLAHQAQQRNFPSTEMLLAVYETISHHRERFCTGIHLAVRQELMKRITADFSGHYNVLKLYAAYRYSNLVLEAFSERYADMPQTTRDWHTKKMLRTLEKFNPKDLIGILGHARTMTMSLENAEGMPGKVGTHSYERRHPVTCDLEKVEYPVKFVENFPMVVADEICRRINQAKNQRGISLSINF